MTQLVIAQGALSPVFAEYENQPVTIEEYKTGTLVVVKTAEEVVFVVSREHLIVEVQR